MTWLARLQSRLRGARTRHPAGGVLHLVPDEPERPTTARGVCRTCGEYPLRPTGHPPELRCPRCGRRAETMRTKRR